MITNILAKFMDERTLNHRLQSTSTAGIATAVGAILGFEYRFQVQHIWSWDLFSVAIGFVVIKLSMMAWYRFRG